jgi:hypothetical protein
MEMADIRVVDCVLDRNLVKMVDGSPVISRRGQENHTKVVENNFCLGLAPWSVTYQKPGYIRIKCECGCIINVEKETIEA